MGAGDTTEKTLPLQTTEADALKSKTDQPDIGGAIGTQLGKTMIGTQAGDIGNKLGLAAAEAAIKKMGVADFGISGDKEWAKAFGDSGLNKLRRQPTEEEHNEATKKLDAQVSKLLSPEDQKALTDLQHTLLGGDAKAFGDALNQIKDPEKRAAYIAELNKNLGAVGSSMKVETDSQGNVVVHDGSGTGVVYGADGKMTVHEINQRPDGGITIGQEVLGGPDASAVMKRLSDDAVLDANGDKINSSKKQQELIEKVIPNSPVFPARSHGSHVSSS